MAQETTGNFDAPSGGRNPSPSDHPSQNARSTRRPHRWFVLLPSLALLYPLGLFLLFHRPGMSRARRWGVALLTLPLFLLFTAYLLRPYVAFDGGMQRVWLDFRKAGRQAQVVARHRSQSPTPSVNPDASAFASLWYPAFRGEHRDGHVTGGAPIALDWAANPPRERWRIPVGDGWSSMSIGYGRLYTLEQRGGEEAVTCYDAETGTELWVHAYPARFVEELGGDGPRSTPTLHDGRVFAVGAEGHFTCLDARTGRRIWQRHINRDFGAKNLYWAMSGSPFVYGETVIVTNSGVGGGSIIAYTMDGDVAWTSDVGQQTYSSPVVETVAGVPHLLNLAAEALNGVDPVDGTKLWSVPFGTELGITASQPLVIDGSRIFVSAGYGAGCKMVRIDRSAAGFVPAELWSSVRMKNKFSSSVYHEGHLYGLDERVLACVDATTGALRWKGGRYNYGSLLLVQGHLLVLSEEGDLVLVRATPDSHDEVGRVQILHDKTWNNHVLVGGILFARNHREMVCHDLR